MKLLKLILLLASTLLLFGNLKAQTQLNLLGQLSYSDDLNDIWGYAAGGKEYALVGLTTGFSIVDVTNPANPVETQYIPDIYSVWRDIKTWGDHAYVTNESGGGLLIIDLSGLPGTCSYSFWNGAGQNYIYNGSSFIHDTAHNIFIDEFGYGYLFGGNSPGGGGTLILDIAANLSNPLIAGHYDLAYCHDGYARNNILYTAELFNGSFAMVDVSNKSNIGFANILGTAGTTFAFTHNIWLSDDSNYAYTTDEVSGAEIGVYDISDPSNIQRITGYQSSPGTGVIPHNVHVNNDYLITSYYEDGITVVCAQNPRILTEVGYFDTYPFPTSAYFNGCWGVYPFLPSGILLASDFTGGLFVIDNNFGCSANIEGIVTDQATGNPVYNAVVTFNPQIYSDNTNFNGYYGVGTANNNGTYTVTVTANGYNTYTTTVTLTDCQTVTLDVVLNDGTACPAASFTGLPTYTSSSSPINLTGSPPGGTFSGPGVIFNAFNPGIVSEGTHTITYSYDDGNGCTGTASNNILVFSITYNFVNYNLGTILPKQISLNNEGNLQIENVYPVPSNDILNIELTAPIPGEAELVIISVDGKTVKNVSTHLMEGVNVIQIEVGQIPAGNYLIELHTSDEVVRFPIVK